MIKFTNASWKYLPTVADWTHLFNLSSNLGGSDQIRVMLERIYNPIMAMGFSAMFTFQLDNTKR